MKNQNATTVGIVMIALVGWAHQTDAQEYSQYKQRAPSAQATGAVSHTSQPQRLSHVSPYYRENPSPKEVRKHDLITIRVDEKAITASEGEMQRRKTASFDSALLKWLRLDGLAIRPDPGNDQDRSISATLSELSRSEGDLETLERVTFDITAEVADIRANGTLVLAARKTVRINDESWQYALSGLCRIEDIAPNNVVLSSNIAELDVHKRERGTIRDSYRRGWVMKWYDAFRPF